MENMDKFGWQRPDMSPGSTGIQRACAMKRAQRTAEKVEMIAAGNVLANMRERDMKDFMG
jgi:hypothetical protein